MALPAAAALLAGAGSAAQARANGELSRTFAVPVEAALWSFASGWLLLLLGLLVLPSARQGLSRVVVSVRARRLQWWELLGGLGGGLFVAVQTFAVPAVGVAIFTIAIVGGQTVNALVVDRLGLGPAGRVPVTAGRVVAALATFVGVGVAAAARSGGPGSTGSSLLPVALTVLAGAGLAVQQAVNGKVNGASGDVFATSTINFTWGLAFLGAWAGVVGLRGGLRPPASLHAPWWAWTGGLVGIVFVAVGAVVVHHLGVLVAALMTLTGQLVTAVLLDLLAPAPGARVTASVLVGTGLTLAAAIGAGVAAQRARGVAR